jgi:hypothetical protein
MINLYNSASILTRGSLWCAGSIRSNHFASITKFIIQPQRRHFGFLAVTSAELDKIFWREKIGRNIVQMVNMNNFSSNIFPATSFWRKCVQMMSSVKGRQLNLTTLFGIKLEETMFSW